MLGPDEPRYAAIGREMARTGDFVAPVLWGKPWFEKPPLLYWMTAAATRLGPDLAPRVPVAVLAWGFVLFLWWITRSEFGETEALFSAAILGTSVAWLAYGFVAVTDLPLAATFCAALLLALYRPGWRWAAVSGALLGLAVLAKGLIPLVLIAPVVWPLRRRIRDLLVIGVAALVVAGPWYAAMTARFGRVFLDDFIWKHHFQRFATDALQHVRPWWFYLPVLLGAILPWTPVLAVVRSDRSTAFLWCWVGYTVLFFSASRNKLPGYILPVIPILAMLLGTALARARNARVVLAVSGWLAAGLLVAGFVLPEALKHGLSRAPVTVSWWIWAVAAGAAGFVWLIRDRVWAGLAVAGLAIGFVLYLKTTAGPELDRQVSARSAWTKRIQSCLPPSADRDLQYGLNYYAGQELPPCR